MADNVVPLIPLRNARAEELLELGQRCRDALDALPSTLGLAVERATEAEVPESTLTKMRWLASCLETAFDTAYDLTGLKDGADEDEEPAAGQAEEQ